MTSSARVTSADPTFNESEKTELLRQFDTQGYIILPQAIPQEVIRQSRALMIDAFEKRRERGETIYEGYRDSISDVYRLYPEIFETLGNARVVVALTLLLGENFVVSPETSALRDIYTKIHTDITMVERRGWTFHLEPDFKMVTVACYLQDMDDGRRGGLFIVPGSHKQRDPVARKMIENDAREKAERAAQGLPEPERQTLAIDYDTLDTFEGVDVLPKAGDVLIFNSLCLHRSSRFEGVEALKDGSKLGLFYICFANNRHVQSYMDFLMERVKLDPEVYDFLAKPRDVTLLAQRGRELGFTIL